MCIYTQYYILTTANPVGSSGSLSTRKPWMMITLLRACQYLPNNLMDITSHIHIIKPGHLSFAGILCWNALLNHVIKVLIFTWLHFSQFLLSLFLIVFKSANRNMLMHDRSYNRLLGCDQRYIKVLVWFTMHVQ